jgi:hypothetical protein
MEKIETIKDRMKELNELFPDKTLISIETEIIDNEFGVRAKATIAYNREILATAHAEKWIQGQSGIGEEATAWAETRAVSRAIGFLLRKEQIHTEEDLIDLANTRLKSFYKFATSGASLEELKRMVDESEPDFVKRKIQVAFSSLVSKKQMDEAKKGNIKQ